MKKCLLNYFYCSEKIKKNQEWTLTSDFCFSEEVKLEGLKLVSS